MIIGKMTAESKTQWKPSIFMFGGCMFVNWIRRSVLIPMPQWLIQEMLLWGFNPYGD